MKTILIILLFLISGVGASEWDTYFEQGNQAYAAGQYEQAVDSYLKIVENNIESGELYFNLGNAYYKLDDIGKSIYYYEKAKNYLEGDEALKQNLKIARLKIIDKIEPIPKLFIFEWFDNIAKLMSTESWGWLTLGLFFITSLLFSLFIVFNRRIWLRSSWIFAIIFIVFLIVFCGKIYKFESSEFGIIFDQKVSVVSEPNLGAAELFILHEGTKIKINRKLNDWIEISIADGKTGWCKSDQVGII